MRRKKNIPCISKLSIGLLACFTLGHTTQAKEVILKVEEPNLISHGPMLGRPGATSMGVWARTTETSSFTVHYGFASTNLEFKSPKVETKLAHDNTAWIILKNLKSNTKYHYQVIAEGQEAGPGGTFKTLPGPEDYKSEYNPKGLYNLRFEFACGNNQAEKGGNGPSMPTYATMLREIKDNIDFAILNGDWLYEDKREYPPEEWRKQVAITPEQTPRIVKIAPSITGLWENYKVYLHRGRTLSEWHRHVPTYYTFDDHELINDIYGAGTAGFRHRHAAFRDIGVRGWFDYLGWSCPVSFKQDVHFGVAQLKAGSDILTDPEADFTKINYEETANLAVHWGTPTAGVRDPSLNKEWGDPNSMMYDVVKPIDKTKLKISPPAVADGTQSYSIGRLSYYKFRKSNCEFFMLDTKTHRTLHDRKDPSNPKYSMLGKKQLEWLKKGMKESTADFFFIASSVNFMVPHIGGGGVFVEPNKDEAWTVFFHERENLINFWDELKKPVFILSGDLHNSYSIQITDTVWEFASGPHNSVNHAPKDDEGDRPATGMFQYGPRACDIRWSTYVLSDIPRLQRLYPVYCVVQVNNAFNNPVQLGGNRWVAYDHPQVIFQFFDGRSGNLLYSETISTQR